MSGERKETVMKKQAELDPELTAAMGGRHSSCLIRPSLRVHTASASLHSPHSPILRVVVYKNILQG